MAKEARSNNPTIIQYLGFIGVGETQPLLQQNPRFQSTGRHGRWHR